MVEVVVVSNNRVETLILDVRLGHVKIKNYNDNELHFNLLFHLMLLVLVCF